MSRTIAKMGGMALTGLLILATLGCEDEIDRCAINTSIEMQARFYYRPDSSDLDTILNNLTVYGIGANDSLYQDSGSVRIMFLPLSPFANTSSFVLESSLGIDTLLIRYERNLVLYSEECGFLTFFEIQELENSHNFIDSVAVVNSEVDVEIEEHVKIYL